MRSPSRHSRSHQRNRKRSALERLEIHSKTKSRKLLSEFEGNIKQEPVEYFQQEPELQEEARFYPEDNDYYKERLRQYEKIIEKQNDSIQEAKRAQDQVTGLKEKLRVSEEKLEQARRNSLDDDLLIGKYLRKMEEYDQKLKQVRHVEIQDSLICKFIQACEDLDLERIKYCLKLGVNVNGRSYNTARKSGAAVFALIDSNSPRAEATLYVLIKLIGRNLDVNMRDQLGNTPLIKATTLGNTAAVRLLCGVPVLDVNLSNHLDNTALIQAVRGNNLELVKFFRDQVPAMDWNRNSPIVDAVQEGNVEMLQIFLLTPGISLANLSGSDSTLPAVAVRAEDGDPLGCIKLLSKDLSLSWTDPCPETGESPLSYALEQKKTEIVKILLELPNIDTSGITAPRHMEVLMSVMSQAVVQLNKRLSQVPECPVCLRTFQAHRTVFQCVAGHFVCQDCYQHPSIQGNCTVCRSQMMGRAHGFEHFLQQMF